MTAAPARGVRLAGKVAVVTGAGRGIGAAVATRLAEDGAAVCCVDVDGAGAQATATAIAVAGGDALAVAADVSTDEANGDMIDAAVNVFGGVDVLCANAAIQHMGTLEATPEDRWDDLHRVNLRAVYLGIRRVLPHLRARGGGSVIITASLLAIVGDPDLPAYGAMKGGLRALCRSLAAAHGPENIRVNTICPGDVETPMLADFFAYQSDPVRAREELVERYPLRRFATPGDVANVAAFLASDDAAYVTGTDLVVDGGLLARIY